MLLDSSLWPHLLENGCNSSAFIVYLDLVWFPSFSAVCRGISFCFRTFRCRSSRGALVWRFVLVGHAWPCMRWVGLFVRHVLLPGALFVSFSCLVLLFFFLSVVLSSLPQPVLRLVPPNLVPCSDVPKEALADSDFS